MQLADPAILHGDHILPRSEPAIGLHPLVGSPDVAERMGNQRVRDRPAHKILLAKRDVDAPGPEIQRRGLTSAAQPLEVDIQLPHLEVARAGLALGQF